MKKITALFISVLILQLPVSAFADAVTADQALARLKEGNLRYVENKLEVPRRGSESLALTSDVQTPFCSILSCSDSRVPVEVIFDQGIGDIFVVRVAGNVANIDEIGSLEYSTEHLHAPLIVVMGHTNCGAVKAALASDGHSEGNLSPIIQSILPAVQKVKTENPGLKDKMMLDAAVKANVRRAIDDLLQKSPVIATAQKAGTLKIVGAVYDLKTGNVEWLD